MRRAVRRRGRLDHCTRGGYGAYAHRCGAPLSLQPLTPRPCKAAVPKAQRPKVRPFVSFLSGVAADGAADDAMAVDQGAAPQKKQARKRKRGNTSSMARRQRRAGVPDASSPPGGGVVAEARKKSPRRPLLPPPPQPAPAMGGVVCLLCCCFAVCCYYNMLALRLLARSFSARSLAL